MGTCIIALGAVAQALNAQDSVSTEFGLKATASNISRCAASINLRALASTTERIFDLHLLSAVCAASELTDDTKLENVSVTTVSMARVLQSCDRMRNVSFGSKYLQGPDACDRALPADGSARNSTLRL